MSLRSKAALAPRAMPVLAAYRPGSAKEPFYNSKGELNASDKTDAFRTLAMLMKAVSEGSVDFSVEANATPEGEVVTAAERRAQFIDAYNDRSGTSWQELGSAIGATIYETSLRQGFMRNFLLRADVQQGAEPRINVRNNHVTAVVATGPEYVHPQWVREKFLRPAEFYISANPRVEEREIQQGGADLMEDVYVRSQESIMVTEDRTYVAMLNQTVGLDNPLQVLAGGLTPANLSALRNASTRWGLPMATMLMADSLWGDIIGNAAEFAQMFDPATQYELNRTGKLGTILGMNVITDGLRDPSQKVLSPGEVFLISDAPNHGAYTDRGPVTVTPQDAMNDGSPSRGWYMYELVSMVVANARSVVKGVKAG